MFPFEDGLYVVTPDCMKKKLLLEQSDNGLLYQMNFASLEEVKEHYFFTIKKEAILYLLDTTDYSYDVIVELLRFLYVIDDKKTYRKKKLIQLQHIKKLLDEQGFLEYDETYLEYILSKKVLVIGYPLLEPYEVDMLDTMGACYYQEVPSFPLPNAIHYDRLYDEVVGTCQKMRLLNANGVPYSHMVLAGVDDSYYYALSVMCRFFDIPIMIPYQNSIYSTIWGRKFLQQQNSEEIKDKAIRNSLTKIVSSLSFAKNSKHYLLLLEKEMQKALLEEDTLLDAVQIQNQVTSIAALTNDTQYVFILGINQNKIPTLYKDEDFLNDSLKDEVALLTTAQKNKQMMHATAMAIASIKHVTLSYKDTSLQQLFYPSNLLASLHIESSLPEKMKYCYSDCYNRYLLGTSLDKYYKYHEKTHDLANLLPYYNSAYSSFDHHYHTITKEKNFLTLSYSQLDDYALCPFRYYAKYILQLDPFVVSFPQKLGTIYHTVLSHLYDSSFDFEKVYQKAVCSMELDSKEQFLLKRLKKELSFIVQTIREQEQQTGLQKALVEKKLEIRKENYVLKGFIDKILYCQKNNQTYYAFFDYKTGNVELNLDYINSGLHLQLPIYLYLIEKTQLFDDAVFAGFFYQCLLKGSKEEEKKKQDLKLFGYTAQEESILAILDDSYEKSQWIKGLALTKDGTLSSRAKVLSEAEQQDIIDKVENVVEQFAKRIQENDFVIAPKICNQQNISCLYCPFKEICFHDYLDNQLLEKDEKEVEQGA